MNVTVAVSLDFESMATIEGHRVGPGLRRLENDGAISAPLGLELERAEQHRPDTLATPRRIHRHSGDAARQRFFFTQGAASHHATGLHGDEDTVRTVGLEQRIQIRIERAPAGSVVPARGSAAAPAARTPA